MYCIGVTAGQMSWQIDRESGEMQATKGLNSKQEITQITEMHVLLWTID